MNLNSLNGNVAPAPPAPKRGPPIAVIVIVILVIIGIVVGIVMATMPAPKAAALPATVPPPPATVTPPPPATVPPPQTLAPTPQTSAVQFDETCVKPALYTIFNGDAPFIPDYINFLKKNKVQTAPLGAPCPTWYELPTVCSKRTH